MDISKALAYCAGLPGAWADNPWDHEFPVFKVGPGERGKIFAFLGADRIGLKCGADRDLADAWLAQYPDDASVMPYLGRSGWNDLTLSGGIDDATLVEAIDDSYAAIVSKLPKRLQPGS